MLAADVALVDIDGSHWANWIDLLVPRKLRKHPRWALLIVDGPPEVTGGGRVIKAIVNLGDGGQVRDPATLGFSGHSEPELRRLADSLGVDAVLVHERAAFGEIMGEVEAELAPGDDMVAQWLVLLRAIKARSGRGIWSYPPLLDLIPPMSYDALQRTFDLLIPNHTSMVAYVFEDGGAGVHTSIIAVKERGHIDLATTHRGIDDVISARALARSWRRDYKRVLDIVAARYAKPSLAVFLDRRAFYRIATGPSDQLARELNARSVIIDPGPAWLFGLLGGATVAAMASRGAKALAQMLPPSARKMASGFAQSAQSALRDSGAHPFALLGFDPVELWQGIRHLYRDHD